MADTGESGTIKIVTRGTYDNRLNNGEIDDTTIYFVIESGSGSNMYLSLYVGKAKQSDIANLNEIIGYTDEESSVKVEEYFSENNIPVKNLLTKNKLYFWEDLNLGVVRAYLKSCVKGQDDVLPLYGTPIWESLE